MHNIAATYDDKLPVGCGYKYIKRNALVTASNQLTINHKDRNMPSLGSRPTSIITLTYALPVLPLGKLPKKLGPQIEVNQRGLCFL